MGLKEAGRVELSASATRSRVGDMERRL